MFRAMQIGGGSTQRQSQIEGTSFKTENCSHFFLPEVRGKDMAPLVSGELINVYKLAYTIITHE